MLSRIQLHANTWTATHQALVSMEFCKQEYSNGLLFPFSGDLPDPVIEPVSPASLALAGRFFTTGPPGKTQDTL